jgi:glycosyltransferase involved in cell wall biosynthesis
MTPIRVLNIFTVLNRGGAETMMMNYYRQIDKNKIQYDFLVHREQKGAYEDEILSLGGRIYRMPEIHPKNFSIYKKKLIQFFDEHPEYIIIHGHTSELGYAVYLEAKKRNIPVIIAHAHLASMNWDFKSLFRLYFRYVTKKNITHQFACGGEAGKWLFGKKDNVKTVILNNAVDTSKFTVNHQIRMQYRKILNIEKKFVIGHIGRINIQKNHTFLIDVFHEIKKIHPKSTLLLVGDGNLKEKIIKKVDWLGLTNDVQFLGVRDDVEQLIQSFDIFLFPSLFEGLPVTLIEAQANGLKCVVSSTISNECKITGNVEFVSLDKSAKEWAEKVLSLRDSKRDLQAGAKIVEKMYDIKSNAVWLTDFYLNSINKVAL